VSKQFRDKPDEERVNKLLHKCVCLIRCKISPFMSGRIMGFILEKFKHLPWFYIRSCLWIQDFEMNVLSNITYRCKFVV
jgi:hypothetical protein